MRIKELRKRRGISQSQIAARMGVDKAAVSRWDSGAANPRTERLPELAALLGCTIDELYDKGEGSLLQAEAAGPGAFAKPEARDSA